MPISDNIKRLRETHGLTQAQFGQIAGVSDKAVSTWEAGLKTPRPKSIDRIAEYFHISKSELLLDPDDLVRVVGGWQTVKSLANAIGVTDTQYRNIQMGMPSNAIPYSQPKHTAPILGRIPAGYPLFSASEIEGYAPIDYPDPSNYFWLRVSGDSMMNAGIQTGDLVLIRQQSCADDGQIVAARVNGDEATLKRFRRVGDTVMLVPENPSYTPIPVPVSAFETGDAAIIGIVVELKRKF